jgi:general secretion pathway protein F
MPSFRTIAIDAAGQTQRSIMEAATDAEVVAKLQRQGSIPIRVEPAGAGLAGRIAGLLNLQIGRRGMSRQQVTDMTRELAVMLAAGQDIDRSLRFIADTAPSPRVLATVEALRRTVRDGGALATALAEHPDSFPRLYIGLVRAGEAGGTLAPTLERLATLMERERALASTIKSAMIYPGLLTLVAIGSITLLLTEVLPQFVPLFEQNGAQLPRPTQILIEAGHIVGAYGLYALLAIALAGLALNNALKRPGIRLLADRTMLRIPIIGGLSREVMAARFTRTLGTLLINGVPLIGALRIVQDAVGNTAGVLAIERATISAKGGAGLAAPLKDSGLFPLRTIDLLRLGEETAQLGPMALRAAEIHEEKTRLGIQRLVALLVPAITIVMGMAIAGIVSSLLLAMLGLNDLASGG